LEAAERRGLIRIRRNRWGRVSPRALFHRVLDLLALRLSRTEQRRYRASAYGCVAATVHATRLPLGLALTCAPVLGYVLSRQPAARFRGVVLAALVPLAVVVLVQATIWLHEVGHLIALGRDTRGTAYFLARPLQAELVYDARSTANRARVAVAGPAVAVVACL